MQPLRTLFIELENNTYANPGYVLTSDLSPEIGIILQSAESALGYSCENMTGDRIILALRAKNEIDLIKELRSAITIYNAVHQEGY